MGAGETCRAHSRPRAQRRRRSRGHRRSGRSISCAGSNSNRWRRHGAGATGGPWPVPARNCCTSGTDTRWPNGRRATRPSRAPASKRHGSGYHGPHGIGATSKTFCCCDTRGDHGAANARAGGGYGQNQPTGCRQYGYACQLPPADDSLELVRRLAQAIPSSSQLSQQRASLGIRSGD